MKVGDEICMFRHEKKFFNPNVFAVAIKASEAGDAAAKKIEAVKTSEIDRVGQKLRVDAIAVTDEGGDAAKFASVVKQVVDGAPGVPIILVSKTPATIEAGIAHCADKKPLIYAATAENAEAMAKIAKEKKASLAVSADGLDALTALSEKVKALGVDDLVLDSGARKAKDMIEHYTIIRRAAIKKNFKPLGYPVITFATRDNSVSETMAAAIGTDEVRIHHHPEQRREVEDARAPVAAPEHLHRPAGPDAGRPEHLQGRRRQGKFAAHDHHQLLALVLHRARRGREQQGARRGSRSWTTKGCPCSRPGPPASSRPARSPQFVTESGVEKNISHKELIIPGYVAVLSGALEEKLPGWKITVGPREANQLPTFLKARA